MTIQKYAFRALACIFGALFLCGCLLSGALPVRAAEGLSDGTYAVNVSNDMPMGKDNIADTATLEADGGVYYLSPTFNVEKLADIRLEIDGKTVGRQLAAESGDTATYCYTLSWEALTSPLPFVADVVPMGQSGLNREIGVTVDVSSAQKVSDSIEDRGERPAEFVPTLLTDAGSEYLLETGTAFTIPPASAALGGESCEVAVSAYYVGEGEPEPVQIIDGRLPLEERGEYRIVYRAESPLYQTSAGNDTFAEYTVTVISDEGVAPVAKFEDVNNILPEGVTLQASRILSGALYDMAAARMKTVSDRYAVFNVDLYDAEGKAMRLSDTVRIGIAEDPAYAAEETEVYYMNEGGAIGTLSCAVLNGYVEFETDRLGTFIVCIPGVAFVMPMWGYAVILAACVLAIAAAVTVTVVLVKRKMKRRAEKSDARKG